MVITKYNRGDGKYTIGSQASINSQKSETTTTSSNVDVNCQLWGNQFDGIGDVEDTMYVNGSVYAMPQMYEKYVEEEEGDGEPTDNDGEIDEYENKEFEPYDDDEGGNVYAQNLVRSDKVYGKTLLLDYPKKIETTDPMNIDETNKKDLLDVLNMIVPVGSIIMHNGSVSKDVLLSYGWAVCDGSNGTPNLKDKFIKGVTATADVGKTGGASTVSLTTANMPSHNHPATSTTTINLNISNGDDDIPTGYQGKLIPALDTIEEHVFDDGGSSNYSLYTGYKRGDNGLVGIKVEDLVSYAGGVSGTATATTTTTIGNTGSGTAFNIEPPYYTLIYIMRIS